MARARGANAVMAAAFETTYGTPPVAGYKKLPFVSSALGDEQNLIMVFPSPMPRGDDVGCNVGAGDTYRSIYATRYGDLNVTPEQALEIAVYQIEQRYPRRG